MASLNEKAKADKNNFCLRQRDVAPPRTFRMRIFATANLLLGKSNIDLEKAMKYPLAKYAGFRP